MSFDLDCLSELSVSETFLPADLIIIEVKFKIMLFKVITNCSELGCTPSPPPSPLMIFKANVNGSRGLTNVSVLTVWTVDFINHTTFVTIRRSVFWMNKEGADGFSWFVICIHFMFMENVVKFF